MLRITFPRGAILSIDLPCSAGARWSRAKYGLPALSPVLPSAGAGWRQCGQACVPTHTMRTRERRVVNNAGQTGDTTLSLLFRVHKSFSINAVALMRKLVFLLQGHSFI